MKSGNAISTGTQGVVLALVIITAVLTGPAYCQTGEVSILIQSSPANGGTISPGIGVHTFISDTEFTLTAVPKPGYQFVYWLGDVADPTASRTVVYLDMPKIIIAVFERSEHEVILAAQVGIKSAPRGGMLRSGGDYGRQGYSGGGAKRPHKLRWPEWPEPEDEEESDFPVPGEDEAGFPVPGEGDADFPVPDIPEPATAVLLALGTLLAARKRAGK